MMHFEERKGNVRRAYKNYQQGKADADKVRRELEILIHTTWQHYGKQ